MDFTAVCHETHNIRISISLLYRQQKYVVESDKKNQINTASVLQIKDNNEKVS